MTKDEKIALNKIAELGCILCSEVLGIEGGSPAELHHVRRYGSVRSASPVLPLCPEHHRGNTGVHGLGKKVLKINGELPIRSYWKQSIKDLESELKNEQTNKDRL
jgi:hypothetical protein